MAKIKSIPCVAALAIAVLVFCGSAAAATWHVDAETGNDTTGNGSEAAPFKTIARVRPLVHSGDTVVLYDGEYGSISEAQSGPINVFNNWVTFRAAEGTSPALDRILFGANGGQYTGDVTTNGTRGTYNVYLRFQGLQIRDGLQSYGAKNWELIDCLIERAPPWTGSVADIEKTAVAFRSGSNILIQNCEITRTGTGIAGSGHNVRILNNNIHDGTHDGIRCTGMWHSLVEGNRIHTFDDGVTDAEADWSRHCDLIHIFIPGNGVEGMQNHDVVFRNNLLYDAEAQGVQFNNYYAGPARNELIVFENNIFGPTKANLFNNAERCDGLIIRNNTVLYFPQGRTLGRWTLTNHNFRIGPSTAVEIYNNIFVTIGIDGAAQVDLYDWNLLQTHVTATGVDEKRAFGRFTLIGVDPKFVNVEALDGRLQADSPAINAGTALFAPSPVHETDYHGTLRDLRPDIGAVEKPGLSPVAEEPPPVFDDHKTIFVDDFEDGHYMDVDPWLQGPNQQGLSWWQPDLPDRYSVSNATLDRNALSEPIGRVGEQRIGFIFSDQGRSWADYNFIFDAYNAYLTIGGGPMLLAIDQQNYYWLDISRDTGRLLRYMTDSGGTMTVVELARNSTIEMPHNGRRQYKISVTHEPGAIVFAVDADNNGSVDFTYRETNAAAVAKFTSGGVGFHGDTAAQYHRLTYDNIRVEVQRSIELAVTQWQVPSGTGYFAIGAEQTLASLAGLRELRISFTQEVDADTIGSAPVDIIGQNGGDMSQMIDSVTLSADGRTLIVQLSGPLPDADRYSFSLAAGLRSVDGTELTGSSSQTIAVLAGDIDGSGRVDERDVLAARAMVGQPLSPDGWRYDVDGSGSVSGADLRHVRKLMGSSLP